LHSRRLDLRQRQKTGSFRGEQLARLLKHLATLLIGGKFFDEFCLNPVVEVNRSSTAISG